MRDRGTFNFSGNLEVKKDAPLEARSLVNSYTDLVKPETWTDEQGGIWKYDCMLVSCKDRPGKVYQLSPGADYTKQSSWILIGDTSKVNNKIQQFIDSKGNPNGLASLNESGVIPSAQLPSYVDDVIEVTQYAQLPETGESGKIYIVTSTNIQYRWSGSAYVEISKSIALGETSSTAYPGDKGKATTDIVNSLSDNLVNDVLVAQSSQTSVSLTVKSITKNPILADGNPILLTDNTPILLGDSESLRMASTANGLYSQANDKTITINQASTSTAGVMSASDKAKLDSLKTQTDIENLINGVQDNLNTHINNKSNPHKVTKAQVGLSEVDNTSDVNKPISNATQTALNGKFSATDGNALKQTIEDMPNLIVTEGRVQHKNNNISLSLRQQDLKDPVNTDSILLTFNPATDSTAGIILPSDKSKIDKIITNGNGTKYLSDNGTYKEVQGGSADYGKVIDVPNGSYLTMDKNVTGTEAIKFINDIFGSTGKLKEVVMDILEHHQKYLFHSYVSNIDCLGISNVYAYYEYAKEEYKLQYNVSYYTTNGPVSKRMAFKLMPNNEDCVAISEDLLPDWHSIKNVLNNGNEFNFADGEVGERVWLNYRSRSGNTVSAGKLYIGNGQATGGFAEVHASGFFKESDIRLKSNIVPLNHTLDQICNIPTVEFDMHDKHQIGTIAQDLENNFAEIVNTDSDGMKSVDYCMLGVVAIEGIKLLKQEVEDLKKQIKELKNGR